jgi:hypothetical protein
MAAPGKDSMIYGISPAVMSDSVLTDRLRRWENPMVEHRKIDAEYLRGFGKPGRSRLSHADFPKKREKIYKIVEK